MWSDCEFINIVLYTYTIYGLNKVWKIVRIREVIECVAFTVYITYVSNSKVAYQFTLFGQDKVLAWNNSILFTKVQLHCNKPYVMRSTSQLSFQPSVWSLPFDKAAKFSLKTMNIHLILYNLVYIQESFRVR